MHPAGKAVAVTSDLMFVVKINDAAKKAGLQIVCVKSQEDAVTQAGSRPRLMIIDLNCPSVDGVALIRSLKASPELRAIPLVAFLSHVQVDLGRAAQEAGCDMVLPRSAFSQDVNAILARHAAGA